jgi:hypothetical protein
MKGFLVQVFGFIAFPCLLTAQSPYQSDADFLKYAEKLRESAILHMEPRVVIPADGHVVSLRYPWKTGIVTTTFSIEHASAWDPMWNKNYGGYDDPKPDARQDYVPKAFVPKLNPFYIALPYNDVAKATTKPEAKVVIPWFKASFIEEGKSVCQDRWVAIRNSGGKVCYAQWSDCGPFGEDHWQYVFGNEKPKPNANGGAGLNVSPAVRDYLDLGSTDVTDWKFVETAEVPPGPWSKYGTNNPLTKKPQDPQGEQRKP